MPLGQYLLKGQNLAEKPKLHSGAGRFTIVEMNTMTWQEMGFSNGLFSLSKLLQGAVIDGYGDSVTLDFIIERLIIGGFPTLLKADVESAMDINNAYIDLLAEVDMSRVSDIKRDPQKIRALLRSLSRNTATMVDNSTLEKDIKSHERNTLSRPTIIDYLDALSRLMILYEQPAFNPHIRSAASLRKSPKRHLCDVGLAVAALGLDKGALLNDLQYTGFLFESLATHELNVYAKANDATLFHYRDSYGLEVDAIAQKRNGDYAAFEIKLGVGYIDEAVESLTKFANTINTAKMDLPKSLTIITGTGMSYRRPDGINVISLAALGN